MTVGVHPLAGFDKLLHYQVPESLSAQIAVGSLVRIPIFNRLHLGIVAEIDTPIDFPMNRLKRLAEVVYPFPALPKDLLALARWMSVYYAAKHDSIVEAMLPAAVRNAVSLKQEKLLSVASQLPADELAVLAKRAPAQAKLYQFLAQQFKPQSKSLVLNRLGVTAAVVAALVKRGLVNEQVRRVERIAYADSWSTGEVVASQPHALNPGQQTAVDAIAATLAEDKFVVTLLHGVTGSGKTEVYLRAIQDALNAGGGVVFLVPEVALTPQTVARLRGRLEAIAPGQKCVVWHSHLSEGERLDGWMSLATGAARVVVGARSAIFAPVHNLKLIVVDEEHEPAYKQDDTPRYHGRDVAVMRAKLNNALCLLGSATPSLESFVNAQAGKYRLLGLPERVDARKLPYINIVDMRIEVVRQRGFTSLSGKLVDAMHARFEKREQTILFLNRRGYSPSMQCTKCGHVEECPHCSITMTYHRTDERLRCHLCGKESTAPARCPAAPPVGETRGGKLAREEPRAARDRVPERGTARRAAAVRRSRARAGHGRRAVGGCGRAGGASGCGGERSSNWRARRSWRCLCTPLSDSLYCDLLS
jgi:primosomal protein N' (replication factor Y)